MTDRTALHLLRHADAGDPEAWSGSDSERPLSPKGVRQAERLGRHLAAVGFNADVVLSSPKRRAVETAEIVAGALGVEMRVDERLAGALELGDVDELLRDAGSPARPVLVGHDPDFSDLLAGLVGGESLSLRKGAMARIDVDGGLRPGGGRLRWLLPPDLLPRDH